MAKQTWVYSHERGLRRLREPEMFDGYKEKYPSAIRVACPSARTVRKYCVDLVVKAVDGCKVEPDGTCEHGYPSWLLALRLI